MGEHKEPGYVRGQWINFNIYIYIYIYIVQSEGVERWLKVQETTKGASVPKDSRPTYSWKRKIEGDKENPL